MVTRLTDFPQTTSPPVEPDHSSSSADSRFNAWLTVLTGMLSVPPDESRSIRLELSEHLRERSRDLMLSGATESQAATRALSELGEIAQLAHRFRVARRPSYRRILMNLSLFLLGAGAVGLSVVALNSAQLSELPQSASMPANIFLDEKSGDSLIPVLDEKIDVSFSEESLGRVIEVLSQTIDRTIIVHWVDFEQQGLSRDDPIISIQLSAVPARRIMKLIVDQINVDGITASWHFEEDMIELGLRKMFDRRDMRLVSYDISAMIEHMQNEYDNEYEDAVDQITSLLYQIVSADDWTDNGGDLAQLNVVGGRMFIEAPDRMQREITWILGELQADEHAAAIRTRIELDLLASAFGLDQPQFHAIHAATTGSLTDCTKCHSVNRNRQVDGLEHGNGESGFGAAGKSPAEPKDLWTIRTTLPSGGFGSAIPADAD